MNIPLKKESLPFGFFFFFQGAFYAQITSPLPAIKEASSLTESQIGMCFLCVGIGLLLGLVLFGKLSSRMETQTSLKWTSLAIMLFGPCLSFGLSSNALNVLGLLLGIALGIFQGSISVQGILHEQRCGRNVMGALYAGNNLGSMAGCLMTSFLMGGLGFSLLARLSVFTVAFTLVWFWACRHLISGSASKGSGQDEAKPGKSKLPVLVFVMGAMSLGAMDLDATVGNWGSILLAQNKGAAESLSALPYAAASLGMFFGRLFCDRLRGRIGACCSIFFGVLLAWGGLVFSVYIPGPFMALLGFFCVGFGIAPVSPILMSAVGSLPGVDIARASAVVSLIGSTGFLILPGAQGFLAERFSIEVTFLSAILVSLVTLLGSFALRGKS